jgi:hypothetical protein
MMKDVDAFSWYYDPLICEYDMNVCSARCRDIETRPAAYASQSFPDFALRCPNDLPSVPSLHNVSFPLAASSSPTQDDTGCSRQPSIHGVTNFPVRACLFHSVTAAPSPLAIGSICYTSASCDIVSSSLPVGWLSVGSRRGGLGFALSILNPNMSSMPVLIVEHNDDDCKLCSLLAPNLPNVCLSFEEFVSICSGTLGSSADAADSVTTFAALFFRFRGLNGFDCHCPLVEVPDAIAWLRSAFRVLNFASAWPPFGCVLLTSATTLALRTPF